MAPRSPTRLALLPLLLVVLAAGWILWPEAPSSLGSEDSPAGHAEDPAAAPVLNGEPALAPGSISSETVERFEAVDPQSGASEDTPLSYPPERDILVRAELTTLAGEQGHPPKDCKGWTVVAQTWLRETGEVARFTAVCDEKGIAEFHFPDFVHVDWVTCLPPDQSPYGFSFLEEHEDLHPSDDYLALLHMQGSHGAFGRVQDHLERPVAGAVVHAFDQNWTYGLNDWTPGFLTTTTNGSGTFRFEKLPPGTWVFAVEPEDWLMIEPPLHGQQEGMGIADIRREQKDPIDVGDLQVVPMATVEIDMTGADGNPVVAADLYVQPLAFDIELSPLLAEGSLNRDHDPADAFLSDARVENYFDDFPYTFYFRTDTSGHAVLRLLRGRYQMQVSPIAGMADDPSEHPAMEFHTDQGSVHYRFPVPIGEVRGQVLASDGTPLVGAQVNLGWDNREGWEEVDRETDITGAFQFQSVRLGGSFKATVWPDDVGWLPAEFDLSPSDMREELSLTLRPASSLRLDFDFEILPDRVAYLKLLDFTPAAGVPFDPEDYWWRQRENRKYHMKRGNRVSLKMIDQGTYTVALFHSEQGYSRGGGTEPRMREIQRWTVSTDQASRILKVDWPR